MKQQSDTKRNDFEAVKKALSAASLPENLSAQAIEDLVTGVRQKKSKKGAVRRAVAGVVAASIVLCGLFVLDAAVYAPSLKPNDNEVVYVNDYSKILSIMKDYKKSEAFRQRIMFSYSKSDGAFDKIAVGVPEVAPASPDTSQTGNINSSVAAADFSVTNTRVDGIGEADVVKTDGRNLYIAGRDKIRIVKPGENGKLEKLASFEPLEGIADKDENEISYYSKHSSCRMYDIGGIQGLYVNGTQLWADFCCRKGGKTVSGVVFYDISDPSAPVLKKVVIQDGLYISSRAVGGSLVLVSRSIVSWDNDIDVKIIPEVCSGEGKDFLSAEKVSSRDIAIASTESPDGFVIVSKIDTQTFESKPETTAVLGGGSDIYCTDKTLYIATMCLDGSSTKIIAFDITDKKPSLSATGSVKGRVLDTFSMDEFNGYVRIATQDIEGNRIYVLDKAFKEVGIIENIAKGEQIKAVRFSGETGYVVTFLQTDPLFVIDLKNPEKPEIKGELKIPGFSSYLHPVGKNLLLGVGVGGTESGTDGSAKLSLFDVADPTSPKETDTFILSGAWFETNYKAFVADTEDNAYFVPYSRWGLVRSESGKVVSDTTQMYAGILRIAVENGKITKKCNYEVLAETKYKGNYATVTFSRAAFVGNTVYGIDCYGVPCCVYSFDKSSGTHLGEEIFD